eukprot:CAMPEP_0114458450 /NCGR_PEP_ID=MMETSP0104-20121206/4691_1 /TAXON_ID=37642 ORGANISM="Paraphysomonas imperforata, Strain PA2" /NCGR_SAMPLE_ID=MMETSP0104 /ASSEMBLY_ACC=CAM_ASM_000202 /LENGTH=246 /DNA_ID=CAMNT_0001631041 /DNA_START=1 /DNA_END=742 /DNA_ORIENTATION=-
MDIREREIDDLFYKYGRIVDIDIKSGSRPPAFAFISFDDSRDADDAIRGRDGYMFDGNRLRVEYSKGSRGGRDDRRDDDRGRRGGGGGGRRSEWGCVISKLPKSASWQDVKDFMRKAGDVIYADVDRNGNGVCEYSNEDDMHNAVRKLDDTEFTNRYDSSYVRVALEKDVVEAAVVPAVALEIAVALVLDPALVLALDPPLEIVAHALDHVPAPTALLVIAPDPDPDLLLPRRRLRRFVIRTVKVS